MSGRKEIKYSGEEGWEWEYLIAIFSPELELCIFG